MSAPLPRRYEHAQAQSRAAGAAVHALDITTLYRRYGDMVLARCRTLLRSEAEAEEAAQDTFLRAWRHAASFRGESAPSTWLFRIATTTALNRIRSRKRRPEDAVAEIPAEPTDGLLDAVELKDLLAALSRDEPEETWQAVVHFYLDGMTHDEIGELLGVGGAAVRKRIATFRTRARGRADLAFLIAVEEEP